jgi:hypothetical protein
MARVREKAARLMSPLTLTLTGMMPSYICAANRAGSVTGSRHANARHACAVATPPRIVIAPAAGINDESDGWHRARRVDQNHHRERPVVRGDRRQQRLRIPAVARADDDDLRAIGMPCGQAGQHHRHDSRRGSDPRSESRQRPLRLRQHRRTLADQLRERDQVQHGNGTRRRLGAVILPSDAEAPSDQCHLC